MSTRTEPAQPLGASVSIDMSAAPVAQPDVLREVIQGMLRCALRSGVSDTAVLDRMRLVCLIARREGVQPEYLLVGLKRAWREIPEVRRMLRDVREAALSLLITLCIEEYYAPPRGMHARP